MSQRKRPSAKRLECHLQETRGFGKPKVDLEQYVTPPHIAAQMLHFIDSKYNDLYGKFVADLGCGTGRLSIGCILCGASQVTGFDIDRKALHMALDNVDFILGPHKITRTLRDETEEGQANLPTRVYQHCKKVNFVCADIANLTSCDDDSPIGSADKKFDTVIMNPPFGTKNNQGIDMVFLKQAIRMSAGSVYSLHKTSTRDVSCLPSGG